MNNSENKSNQNTLFETTMELSNKEKTNTQEYSCRILQYLDVDRFYKLVNSLGPQLNGRKDRFDKSDIIEQSIDVFSNGKFKYVDQEGYDLIDEELNVKIEVKYEDHGLITKTGKKKRHINSRIKNTLKELTTPTLSNPADYYLFLEKNGMALISYKDMEEHLFITKAKDCIVSKIPFGKAELFSQNDKKEINELSINYKKEKHALQRRIIDLIK
jgi:hypothetical protein